jgi:hypothetical protein
MRAHVRSLTPDRQQFPYFASAAVPADLDYRRQAAVAFLAVGFRCRINLRAISGCKAVFGMYPNRLDRASEVSFIR